VRVVANGKAPADQAGPSKVVPGRHISFKYLDSTTTSFFFTNFPKEAKYSDLWRLFACFGFVGEVFIPNKLDKWGRKFGFVKFKEVKDVVDLERRLEVVWLWDTRLKVNIARFGREV